jgi:hypothetical protein
VGRDEALECASCERFVCSAHQAICDIDGEAHCPSHLARTEQSQRLVCESDRASCAHEPDVVFAADEVIGCPVCARHACTAHTKVCANCGRRVCDGEWDLATEHCATCRQLAPYGIPSEAERAAALQAGDGNVPKQKHWRGARDATHIVFEMTHAWKRRTVFTVRHGENRADTIMSHTRQGSTRKR